MDNETDKDGYTLAECGAGAYLWREVLDDTEPTRLAWRQALAILKDARRKEEGAET